MQPCEDHVSHVARSRGHQDEACDGPRDTGQLIKKIIWNIANESVAIVKSRDDQRLMHGSKRGRNRQSET